MEIKGQENFSTNQAAEWLGTHPTTMRRWRSQGRGPAFIRVSSRMVLYRKSDLESWLRARRVEPQNN